MISIELLKRYYPDDIPDVTQQFFGWIRENITPDSVMLDLGAGTASPMPIKVFKGEVRKVVGADIDEVVLTNDQLDEAHVIREDALPFPEGSFDIVISDYVLEHVRRPRPFLGDVYRVLKRSGSFFFRTPNRFHYVSIIARLTPHWFHQLVANRARGGLSEKWSRQYPTYYRMNDRGTLRRLARQAGFGEIELRCREAHPAYLMFHALPFMAGVAYERFVNRFELLAPLRVNILGRLKK
jgi:ubiquinone/menaquinone biosynthesis C-methylase UbiE